MSSAVDDEGLSEHIMVMEEGLSWDELEEEAKRRHPLPGGWWRILRGRLTRGMSE